MKKIFYSLFIILAATLGLQSCDNLDLAPEDNYGSGNFWTNEGQVQGYIYGLHSNIRSGYQKYFYMGEARGGTFRTGVSSLGTSMSGEVIKTNALTADNVGLGNWGDMYNYILQVNHFIEQVENKVDFLSEESRNYYLGQAYGIRAFYYFMLHRTYGGVPLEKSAKVTSGGFQAPDLYMARSTEAETLAFIKEDINKSETYFGNNSKIDNKNTWSKNVTLTLKAEIYLWAAKVSVGDQIATGKTDLEIAKSALLELVGKYSLEKNFADLYEYTNKRNEEIIFSLYFDRNESSNWGDQFVYSSALFINVAQDEDGNVYGDPLDLYGSGWFLNEYLESFVKSYAKEDSRRSATFLEYYMKDKETGVTDFGASCKKMLGHAEAGSRFYDSDIIIYRYADVLLMLAEVENGLGNSCAKYINQIRERAYGSNYNSSIAYSDGSYADNELAILKERDKEFVTEGKRWFDLRRMHDANKKPLAFSASANYPKTLNGTSAPVLKETEAHKLLWPIEVKLLNDDPLLKQTAGY